MTSLNPPVFTTPDAAANEAELIAKLSELLGKTLFPAQIETLLANFAAYLKTVTESKIQYTGEQNLVNYAVGSNLDQIGANYNVPRLDPQAALTTLEFTLVATKSLNYLVPAGTRARTADGDFLFATTENLIIPAGDLSGQVIAECTTVGKDANDYAIGDVNFLFDLLTDMGSVTNVTVTNSGSDVETDAGYRKRLLLAFNQLSTAGSRDSYRFWALSADPSIVDVSVRSLDDDARIARQNDLALDAAQAVTDLIQNSPFNIDLSSVPQAVIASAILPYVQLTRFYVEIYPLTSSGLPSSEIIAKVRDAVDQNTVRPLTDTVKVLTPTQINQPLSVSVIAYSSADTTQLLTDLNTAAAAYAAEISSQLGRDIVISQIEAALSLPGVYSVVVGSPVNTVAIAYNQRAFISSITINLTGVTDG